MSAFKKAPEIAGPIYAKAINAGLANIQKYADDKYFQFKTPRQLRTGMLQKSFAFGIKLATDSDLVGSIGPTVHYAKYVHFGTKFITANPFMERIALAASPDVSKQFEIAVRKVTEAITSK